MYRVCESCLTHVEAIAQQCPFCESTLEDASSHKSLQSVARVSGRSSVLAAALGVTLSLNIACNKLAPEPQPAIYGGPPVEEQPVAEEPASADMGNAAEAGDAGADMTGGQGAASPGNKKRIPFDAPPASIYGGPPVDIYGAPPIDDDDRPKEPQPDPEDSIE